MDPLRAKTNYQAGDVVPNDNKKAAEPTAYTLGAQGSFPGGQPVQVTFRASTNQAKSRYQVFADNVSSAFGGRPNRGSYQKISGSEKSEHDDLRQEGLKSQNQKSFLNEVKEFFFDEAPPFSKTLSEKKESFFYWPELPPLPNFSFFGGRSEKLTGPLLRDLKNISFGEIQSGKSDPVLTEADFKGKEIPSKFEKETSVSNKARGYQAISSTRDANNAPNADEGTSLLR